MSDCIGCCDRDSYIDRLEEDCESLQGSFAAAQAMLEIVYAERDQLRVEVARLRKGFKSLDGPADEALWGSLNELRHSKKDRY
jgi:hypothetical protein